ncbi:MAG: fimbrillin family protein [Bacteroidaceae bacterium]|nr:fimbrillin family protein [Bacteroidaceae bacterium]
MKKSFYLGLITLATMSMASCSNDEVFESMPQNNAIEFSTYLGRDAQTRAPQLVADNFKNFGVFASYTQSADWSNHTPNFMYNQYVVENTGTWSYSPKKYWPTKQGEKISFFAYAPHANDASTGIDVTSNNSHTGAPTIKYTVSQANLATQADFVADVLMNQIKEGDGSSLDDADRTVKFTLNHELTRVGFEAKLDRPAWGDAANKTQVNITSIKFQTAPNLYETATYTFATTNDPNVRGEWSAHTTHGSDLDITSLLNTSPATELGDYTKNGILLKNTTAVTLFKKTDGVQEYLFLIPKDEDGTDADGMKIEVEYDIVTQDDALVGRYSCTSAKKVIVVPEDNLQQGKAYNFVLTFGLNEIVLDAVLTDWDKTDVNQNVDWPKVDA